MKYPNSGLGAFLDISGEAKCRAFRVKVCFVYKWMKTSFHNKTIQEASLS